ncbi:DUF3313 domain-containing protein [Paraburkholderia phymatum]|uniref:Putative lipoprotein n=1 Tax=Paraburkholderia phymatum (strain DSM 17167 / CIP 108236 / LMG 21445 / STM815) TaxID=391038 RepID=B2JWQ4_PARP8|nr:DUF3313 domain-containing protein [Paraburkholderia phymatum]ACC75381.1 putative lipoprotein [Paraburkholderia phymatum STM815]
MRNMTLSGASAIAVAAVLVAGCASNNTPTKSEYSGFLGDYSNLQQTQDAKGETFLRYINPKLTPANYSAVIVEPISMYPKAEPTEQLSQATIDQVRSYATTCLTQSMASKVRVVQAPGPGVLRLQVAITGVASTAEGLKPYQVVPMAFVATMAVNSIAGAPQQAKLLVEARGTDSVSGDVLAKVVRTHTGEKLGRVASNEPVITFESVKPIMDDWCDTVSKSVSQYIKPR